jgi:aspartate/methionine/tyrosine aminotransferase
MAQLISMADKETKQMWDAVSLGYTESYGHPILRQTIADTYTGISAEDVLVVIPAEGIFLVMNALLKPGDHVICTYPAFQSLFEIALSMGCEVSKWEPDEARGWLFDMQQLEDLIREDTKLVVANFPHNPTGFIPSKQDYKRLISILDERGIYLFSDEMFRYLEVEPGATLPSACELYERAVTLFGLSKTFGLPGLRTGWLVTRDKNLQQRILDLKYYTTICSSAPSEILAIIALRSQDEIFNQQFSRLLRNIKVLDSFFERNNHLFKWNRPVGSSMCFPRLLLSQGSTSFCQDLLKNTGIMLAPSSLFDYGEQHIRVGFGREDLPQVIVLLEDYLQDSTPK